MKKLPFKKRRKAKESIPTRITNETVAEHRERILAGGRRFKYPMQYARHRLVINAIIVVLVTVLVLMVIGWWQLYLAQNTSTFFYRVTRIIPAPVASVDGYQVRYSDYLMYYNSSAHYLQNTEQINLSSEDGQRQVAYIKRESMNNVIADGFAAKLAKEMNITVDEARVDTVIENDRNTANGQITQETYDASALSVLGWTPNEYRWAAKSKLLRQDVSYAIDSAAKQKADEAAELLAEDDVDFDKVAAKLGGEGAAKVTAGVSGLVPALNRDGGLAAAANGLEKGNVSDVIKTTTGDGYYFVKLLERKGEQLNYAFLRVPLAEFDTRLAALRDSGKINEYIAVPEVEAQQRQ